MVCIITCFECITYILSILYLSTVYIFVFTKMGKKGEDSFKWTFSITGFLIEKCNKHMCSWKIIVYFFLENIFLIELSFFPPSPALTSTWLIWWPLRNDKACYHLSYWRGITGGSENCFYHWTCFKTCFRQLVWTREEQEQRGRW